ncbi:hypothetical protein Tco_1144353 [Tanacetum coccineum]
MVVSVVNLAGYITNAEKSMLCLLAHRMTPRGFVFLTDWLRKVGRIRDQQSGKRMDHLLPFVHHGHMFQTHGCARCLKDICRLDIVSSTGADWLARFL